MEIHIHIHHHNDNDPKLDVIIKNTEKIMSVVDDLKATLGEINATTDEIAADVTELVAKLPDGPGLEEVKAGLTAVSERLKGVASQYPVPPA